MTRASLDSAPGKLRRRVTAGQRAFVMTVGLAAVPALLVFGVSAMVDAAEPPGGVRAALWPALTRLARVFPPGQDPMETVGALAAIAVAIIFYNARAELPDPGSKEASEEDFERTSTILRTKSVLRLVAVVIAVACWMLLLATMISILAGDRTVFNAVEFIALATLIMLSCNFVISQREEIAQRSLLALDAAISAYDDTQKRRAASNLDQPYRALKGRLVLLGALVGGWLGLSVALAREPVSADAVIINITIAVVSILLHFVALGLVGALRVPWRRGPLLIWLSITMLPLVIAYVTLVGLILVPPAGMPDPRDRAFFAATLALFVMTAAALYPVTEIAATKQARSLRDYISSRESHALLRRFHRSAPLERGPERIRAATDDQVVAEDNHAEQRRRT